MAAHKKCKWKILIGFKYVGKKDYKTFLVASEHYKRGKFSRTSVIASMSY